MPTKIVMADVASYKSSTCLEAHKKVCLVYGLNGTGKSVLSNFLYDPENHVYKHCAVEGFEDTRLLVYNNRFVADYFHEKDTLRGVFTLSKENKEVELALAAEIKTLKNKQTAKESLESSLEKKASAQKDALASAAEETWNVKKQYAGGDRILEFCLDGLKGNKSKLFSHLRALPKPEERPSKTIDELKRESESVKGQTAQRYAVLPDVTLDVSAIESDPLLARTVIGNQNSSIATLIEKLENADWVREGLAFLDILKDEGSNACPFCQKQTITEQVSKAIRDYFDESYAEAVIALQKLESRYAAAIESIPPPSSYAQHALIKGRASEFTAYYNTLTSVLSENRGRLAQKCKAPSQAYALKDSRVALKKLNTFIAAINKDISENNRKIDRKEDTLEEVKADFWRIMRWEYDGVVVRFETQNSNLQEEISRLSAELAEVKEAIRTSRDRIVEIQKGTLNIDEAIAHINRRLLDLGMDSFKIVKHKNNLYRIERPGEGESDFNSLSEGEKTVISFLYFVEVCKGRDSVTDVSTKTIVVIDDPISSLSHIYVFSIGQMIKDEFNKSDRFAHVIVLTHSLYFFYELTDPNHERRKKTQTLFRIVRTSSGSMFTPMRYEEIQNDYQAYWSIVKDHAQPPALIANCMRNIIEYFFSFVEKRDLNNVFEKRELQGNKYQAFYRFMNRESHSLGQNIFDYKEFDYSVFREAFEKVFQASGFHEHYRAMMK